jgi:hypothetical protein
MCLIKLAKKHKKLTVVALILLAILLTFFGARIWLYAHYLLGNDLLIQLTPEQTYLSIEHGQEINVSFKTTITANPFCMANCSSTFFDISSNRVIAKQRFNLSGESSITKTFTITGNRLGTGQDLFQYSVRCTGVKKRLCDTSTEPKERNILLTVAYGLNSTERELKRTSKDSFAAVVDAFRQLKGDLDYSNALALVLNSFNQSLSLLNSQEQALQSQLNHLAEIWGQSDYYRLDSEIKPVQSAVKAVYASAANLKLQMAGNASRYNSLVDNLTLSADIIKSLDSPECVYSANEAASASFRLKQAIFDFNPNGIAQLCSDISNLKTAADDERRIMTVQREVDNDLFSDALCNLSGKCEQHPSISERANETTFALQKACLQTESLKQLYQETGKNASNETNNDADMSARWIIQELAKGYLSNLSGNKDIEAYLLQKNSSITPQDYNISDGLFYALLEIMPKNCPAYIALNENYNVPEKISLPNESYAEGEISFSDAPEKCCVFGRCEACHDDGNQNYPVILIHGHSFNKETAADFSLDAFTQIQDKLQTDGYIDAGTASFYAATEMPDGTWGKEPLPISIKASYYFDSFRNQDGYTIVQAKSESIETYAVRLKEIIDEVKRMTGKDKVNIIAHSMGGLVARRYIQLFDRNDVDNLILLAVPNNGIQGSTSDFCGVFGSENECADMKAGSLLVNKLKLWKPTANVTNIVGTGCTTNGLNGDGVLSYNDSFLPGANNIVVNGTCRQLELLHGQILDINLHPEVYKTILEALK